MGFMIMTNQNKNTLCPKTILLGQEAYFAKLSPIGFCVNIKARSYHDVKGTKVAKTLKLKKNSPICQGQSL